MLKIHPVKRYLHFITEASSISTLINIRLVDPAGSNPIENWIRIVSSQKKSQHSTFLEHFVDFHMKFCGYSVSLIDPSN